jgi:hypothetical protein
MPATSKLEQQPRKRGYREFFIQDEITFTEKTKAITGNALRLQLVSRKHLTKNCLQMEIER